MKPLISVIVPVYNVEEYLPKCLDSIINQTYKNLEIIVVNDGSTDNSGKICDEYAAKNKRIKIIHKTNGGVVKARIEGFNNSTADYIMFVDSDDYIGERTLEIMYETLHTYDVDLVCSQYFDCFGELVQKSPVRPKPGFYDKDVIIDFLKNRFLYDVYTNLAGIAHPLWAKLVKKYKIEQCLEAGEGLFWGEDQVSLLKILYNIDTMFVLPDYLYFYRQREGQVTKTYRSQLWENINLCFEKLEIVDTENYLTEQFKLRKLAMYIMLASMVFAEKNCFEARKEIKKYSNIDFCKNVRSYKYNNLDIKKAVQLFFIKHNCYIFYYLLFKFYRNLKLQRR